MPFSDLTSLTLWAALGAHFDTGDNPFIKAHLWGGYRLLLLCKPSIYLPVNYGSESLKCWTDDLESNTSNLWIGNLWSFWILFLLNCWLRSWCQSKIGLFISWNTEIRMCQFLERQYAIVFKSVSVRARWHSSDSGPNTSVQPWEIYFLFLHFPHLWNGHDNRIIRMKWVNMCNKFITVLRKYYIFWFFFQFRIYEIKY